MSNLSGYEIVIPAERDWGDISELISKSISNAIVSHLGKPFGMMFYKALSEHKCSCVYVCKDTFGCIKGIIIGTADHAASYSAIKNYKYRLMFSANVRILKWVVIKWIVSNIISKITMPQNIPADTAKAELIAIAVSPDMRGKGVADQLVRKWEGFLMDKSEECEYYILTEKSNERANRFYSKIGAELKTTFVSRGRDINCWHKRLHR